MSKLFVITTQYQDPKRGNEWVNCGNAVVKLTAEGRDSYLASIQGHDETLGGLLGRRQNPTRMRVREATVDAETFVMLR